MRRGTKLLPLLGMDQFGDAGGFEIQQVNLPFFVPSPSGDDTGPFPRMGSVVHFVLTWGDTCPFGNIGAQLWPCPCSQCANYGFWVACSSFKVYLKPIGVDIGYGYQNHNETE